MIEHTMEENETEMAKKNIGFLCKQKYAPLLRYTELTSALKSNEKLKLVKIPEPKTGRTHCNDLIKEFYVENINGRYSNALVDIDVDLLEGMNAEVRYIGFLLTGISRELEQYMGELEEFVLDWTGKRRVNVKRENCSPA